MDQIFKDLLPGTAFTLFGYRCIKLPGGLTRLLSPGYTPRYVCLEQRITLDKTYLSYEEAFELTRNKTGWTKIANNTWVQESTIIPGAYGIKLHNLEIITIYPDGRYRLNAGEWHSATTRDRLNRMSPLACRVHEGVIETEFGPLLHPLVIKPAHGGWVKDELSLSWGH